MSDKFFDVDTDPVTEKGVRLGHDWFFPSYEGKLHTVKVVGDEIHFADVWSLTKQQDREGSWRIGGIEHLAIHSPTK